MDNAVTHGVDIGTGLSKNPMSFIVESLLITNYRGEEKDISGLMSTLKIYETLAAPFLVMDLLLVDQMNFFEEFKITGQEKIAITLTTKYKAAGRLVEKRISLVFYVTEYPDYKRDGEHTQIYMVRGVSEHAYISPLKKISKGINGPVTDTISSILKTDLNVAIVNTYGNAACSMTGVVPIQSPLAAVDWLKNKAYDEDNTPFFVYQTLAGDVNITSLSYMMDQPVYRQFIYKKHHASLANTDEDFAEKQQTILSIDSHLNLSKSYNLAAGAYASKARFIDTSTNTLRENDFDYAAEPPRSLNNDVDTISASTLNINRPEEAGVSLNKMAGANLTYRHVSPNAYNGNDNSSRVDETRLQYAKSWHTKFETVVQQVVVPGDFDMHVGYVVELKIPKGLNPSLYKGYTGNSATDMSDKAMGGKYIIFEMVHVFDRGEYKIDAQLRKDTVPG